MNERISRTPVPAQAGAVEVFRFEDIEINVAREGDSFRVEAPGLARALGFREAYDLVRSIPDADKGSELVRTPGGDQRMWWLTEAGFYRALGQRQAARVKDEATRLAVERFQDWVYREVLPAIRRTGGYVQTPQTYVEALEALLETTKRELALEAENATLRPAAAAFGDFLSAEGDYLVGDVAKILSRIPGVAIGQNQLFDQLGEWGWLFRGRGKPRKKQPWHCHQEYVNRGWLVEKVSTYRHPANGVRVLGDPQVRVLPAGLAELHKRFAPTGQLALTIGVEDDA